VTVERPTLTAAKPTRNATCSLAAVRSPPRKSTALRAATAWVSGLTAENGG
jgi:hypothetical protein